MILASTCVVVDPLQAQAELAWEKHCAFVRCLIADERLTPLDGEQLLGEEACMR